MVSIKTVLTLGAIGVAVALFFGAGSFTGVGSKIGGFFGKGFSEFGSSLAGAFSGGLFGGNVNQNTGGVNEDTSTGMIGPPPRTGTEEFDPFGNLFGNLKGLQNILDSINNAITGGGKPPTFTGPAFDDPLSQRDFNLIQLTQQRLGRPINIQRSVAAQRELGNTPFSVVVGGRTRTFATEATALSFIERVNR